MHKLGISDRIYDPCISLAQRSSMKIMLGMLLAISTLTVDNSRVSHR
jgi:hypothetical protein